MRNRQEWTKSGNGIVNKGWVIYTTDKSGKVVLDSKENFLNCMEEHFSMDRIVTPEEVREAESRLNDHVRAWCNVMTIGESAGLGQPRRCRRGLVTNFATIPTLQGLRKDHKQDIQGDPNKGPKLRPLAAANRAPNAALAHLVATILKAVGDNLTDVMGAEVISTEELKREIEEVNSLVERNWEKECEEAKKDRERKAKGNGRNPSI